MFMRFLFSVFPAACIFPMSRMHSATSFLMFVGFASGTLSSLLLSGVVQVEELADDDAEDETRYFRISGVLPRSQLVMKVVLIQ